MSAANRTFSRASPFLLAPARSSEVRPPIPGSVRQLASLPADTNRGDACRTARAPAAATGRWFSLIHEIGRLIALVNPEGGSGGRSLRLATQLAQAQATRCCWMCCWNAHGSTFRRSNANARLSAESESDSHPLRSELAPSAPSKSHFSCGSETCVFWAIPPNPRK